MHKPRPKFGQARILRLNAERRHQTNATQELKKCGCSAPPFRNTPSGHGRMLATKKAPAIVSCEAFDIAAIHILYWNPRQTEPMGEVFGSGSEHAPGPTAVSPQDEMVAVGWKLSGNWSKVFWNRYGATTFEIVNEPADISDVARPLCLLRAVALSVKAQASALMGCKALDDSGIYLSNGNAP
jgi:hypothetical protein